MRSPDEILRSRVTGQSTSGSASVFGFVTHGQSFRFRHTRTKPIVSIDMASTIIMLEYRPATSGSVSMTLYAVESLQ